MLFSEMYYLSVFLYLLTTHLRGSRKKKRQINPISSGVFFPWVLQGEADSAHHFETQVRVGFAILTSFQIIPLMTH